MEQLQQLFEILKETPQMALWGISIWCIFILAKMASWIYALASTAKFFIKRYFDARDKQLEVSDANKILRYFEERKISGLSNSKLIELLSVISSSGGYIHESSINDAINLLKENK